MNRSIFYKAIGFFIILLTVYASYLLRTTPSTSYVLGAWTVEGLGRDDAHLYIGYIRPSGEIVDALLSIDCKGEIKLRGSTLVTHDKELGQVMCSAETASQQKYHISKIEWDSTKDNQGAKK